MMNKMIDAHFVIVWEKNAASILVVYIILKMEATCCLEILVSAFKTARCHHTEDHNVMTRCRESGRMYILTLVFLGKKAVW